MSLWTDGAVGMNEVATEKSLPINCKFQKAVVNSTKNVCLSQKTWGLENCQVVYSGLRLKEVDLSLGSL